MPSPRPSVPNISKPNPTKPVPTSITSVPSTRPRDANPSLLHPSLRYTLDLVLEQLHNEGWPFELYEGYRPPAAQAYLFNHHTSPHRPWFSYHQYGLAADLVLWLNARWTFDVGLLGHVWERLQEVGREYGLEQGESGPPHLQLSGLSIDDLRKGSYPGGGDETWWNNLLASKAT